MEDKVSIIVPIYNVEKFIRTNIESLISQTYSNIEIILIDDGSQDKSGQICDEYVEKDERIKVIHQTNKGVSNARNMGLKIAKGKYILFVDGDDYVSNDYVEYFYNLISNTNCSIGMDYSFYDISSSIQSQEIKTEIISSDRALIDIYIDKINVAVWNKIYRLEFLKENRILFNDKIWYGEGMLFNIECLANTNEIVIGNKKVYYQVYNKNSAMRKFNIDSRYCGIESINMQRKLLNNKPQNVKDAIDYHLRCYNMSTLISILKTNSQKKYYTEYKKCIRNLKKNYKVVMKSPITLKRKLFYLVAMISPTLVAKRTIFKEKQLISSQTNIKLV